MSRVVTPERPQTAIRFPPGVDRGAVLAPLNNPAWTHSPDYRRTITRYDPVRFGLTYLPEALRSRATRWLTSFSPMHIEMAAGARRWAATHPDPIREGWIAPRGMGKSSWQFLILPLWALAHGHRHYVFCLADARGQAEAHLANLRNVLERYPLIVQDFPELLPGDTAAARNSARDVWFSGGAAISARGMDSRVLGANVMSERPDLIQLDDVEPGGSSYSAELKEKRLATIVNDILPMNDQAVVQLAGTVTMWGSVMHDLVRAAVGEDVAEWIPARRFVPHYYPPIMLDRDGWEHSCWPERWSLDYLRAERAQGGQAWALGFSNLPPRPGEGGVGWLPEQFLRRDPPVTSRVVFVDIAVTSKATSDQTGIAVMGLTVDRKRVVVDYCHGMRARPELVRAEVHRLARKPGVSRVVVEVNNGGDWVLDRFRPMPDGVELEAHTSRSRKTDRIMDLLDLYGRGMVLHPRELGEVETQMLNHPGTHDDLIDVVSIGAGHLLENVVRL